MIGIRCLFSVITFLLITGCMSKEYKECRGIDSCNKHINSFKNTDNRKMMLDVMGKQTEKELIKTFKVFDKMAKVGKQMQDIK